MKRKIAYIFLAVLLIVFVVAENKIQIFAKNYSSVQSETSELSFDDAVKKAVRYSKELKNIEENTVIAEEDAVSTRQSVVTASETSDIVDLAVKLKETLNKVEQYKMSSDVEKASIEYSVADFFVSVINSEKSVELYEKELELKKRNIEISATKAKLGKISQNEYDNEVLEYNKKLKEIENLEMELEEAYIQLNKVLGESDFNKKYNLSWNVSYEELGEANLDGVITRALGNCYSIKEKEDAVTLAKYNLNSYTSDENNKITKQYSYNKAVRSLEDAKISLKQKIITTYNSIIKIENEYKANIIELENMKKQLEIKFVQLRLNKITQIEYDEYVYDIESLENTLKKQIYNHTLLVMQFENPDLL